MNPNPTMSFSHIGICISNLERSVRFYTEALGFVLKHYVEGGPPFDVLAEVPEMKIRAGFFERDGVTIELLSYERPGVVGTDERRPMNQLGLTHLSLIVNDIDAVVDRIVKCGGRVLSHTRVKSPVGDMIFCTDPDGVRVELWQRVD
ncbi:MAG: VOC family protein [Rhodospirillaceae bacterium]|nr:MAG: VOC family protein [Rhodospirillaceae bacterium]